MNRTFAICFYLSISEPLYREKFFFCFPFRMPFHLRLFPPRLR